MKCNTPQLKSITSVILVSDRPMISVENAGVARGLEVKQVTSYRDFMKIRLTDWDVCITNMLPVWGTYADRFDAKNPAKKPVRVKIKRGTYDGWEVIIQCIKRKLPVAVYTDLLDPKNVLATYRAQAIGYFPSTSITPDNLLTTLDGLITEGGIYIDPTLSVYEVNTVLCNNDEYLNDLRPSELDVLFRVASGHSSERIRDDMGITDGSLRNRISSILAKSEIDNRPGMIAYAKEIGLQVISDEDWKSIDSDAG